MYDDVHWFENKTFEFAKDIKPIVISISGNQYHSTITTGIMRGILKLQEAINNNYLLYVYGPNSEKRLSSKEKQALELIVEVNSGCSQLSIYIDKIIDAFSARIKTMNTKEIIISIAIVSCITAVTICTNNIIDSKREIEILEKQNQAAQIQNEHERELQQQAIEGIINAQNAQTSFFRAVAGQNADNIEIDGVEYTIDMIKELTKTTRKHYPIETKVYTGIYTIKSIEIQSDALFIDVVDNQGKEISRVNVKKELLTDTDYNYIRDSLKGNTVDITIATTEKNGIILASFLQSIRSK